MDKFFVEVARSDLHLGLILSSLVPQVFSH